MKLATHRKHPNRFELEVEVPYANEDEALALASLGAQTSGKETALEPATPAQTDEETGEVAPPSEDGVARVRFHWPPPPEGTSQKAWADMQRREAKIAIEDALSREADDAGTKVQGEGEEL